MPVDRISVAPALASACSNGALVRSPEPILIRGSLSDSRNSSDCGSNGVDRNSMPRCLGARDQRLMRRLRQFQPLQHGELAFGGVRGALLIIGLWRRAPGQRIGVEGLEFHDVGAGIRGRIDQGQRRLEAAGMIDAGFRDDERAWPRHSGSLPHCGCHESPFAAARENPRQLQCASAMRRLASPSP